MYIVRAFLIWLIVMAAETVHGTLRQLFLAPLLGDLRARQVSVFTGMLLIIVIALLFIRWIAAPSTASLLLVGCGWVMLTALFEITLGRLVLGFSWERLFADYEIARGGLMGLGLLFMALAPLMAERIRSLRTELADE